ncbi:hypothetical protein N6L27_21395 [Leisingera sp. SS27]|uniref:lipoate--protein ligase family protein n=1 Tax=Leisingera sp. SS27 TaxID=2979462 RepID=UPI00232C832C|nr:hypothetical protein [Leisingera sp. SS27]MDC0660568.1 hypothetical protein [Leisingera sp. SS27]
MNAYPSDILRSGGHRSLSGRDAFALEAALMERVASGERSYEVAIWQTEQCLVVPRGFSKRERFGDGVAECQRQGWPVFERTTGGDVTPQDSGTVNVTLVYRLPKATPPCIREQYDVLCNPILEHLRSWGLAPDYSAVEMSFCDGAYNVAVDNQKLVGTAQRWRRSAKWPGECIIFAHALILAEADLKAGIAATNTLYRACGMPDRVRTTAHTNLKHLQPAHARAFDTNRYMDWLQAAYEQDLYDITTSTT